MHVCCRSFLAAVLALQSTLFPVLSPGVVLPSSLCVVCYSAYTTSGYSPRSTWSLVECFLHPPRCLPCKPHTTLHPPAHCWKPLFHRSSSAQRNRAGDRPNLRLESSSLSCILDKAPRFEYSYLSSVAGGNEDRMYADKAVILGSCSLRDR